MDNLQNEGTVLPPIWAYFSFNQTNGRTMCKVCRKTMNNARRLSDLEAHLKRHPTYMKKVSLLEPGNALGDGPVPKGSLPLPFPLSGILPGVRSPAAPVMKNRNSRNSKVEQTVGFKRDFPVWDAIFHMQGSNADVHLICGDGIVPAHAFILQYASSFIDTLFTALGDNYTETRKILLPDFTVVFVQRTIELIYSGSTNVNSRAEADFILEILDTLRIDRKNISLHHANAPGEEPVIIIISPEPEPITPRDEIKFEDEEAEEGMTLKITDVRGASTPANKYADNGQDFPPFPFVVPKMEPTDKNYESPPHTEFQIEPEPEASSSSSAAAPKRRALRSRAKLLSDVSYRESGTESESESSDSSSDGVEFIKSSNTSKKNSAAPTVKKRRMGGALGALLRNKSEDEEYAMHTSATPPSSESSDDDTEHKTPKQQRTRQKVNKALANNARVSALYVKAIANLQQKQKAANLKPRNTTVAHSGRLNPNNSNSKRDMDIRRFWGPHPAASVKNTSATASLKALSTNVQFRGSNSNSNRTQQISIPNLSNFITGGCRKPGIGLGISIPGPSSGVRPLPLPISSSNLSSIKNGVHPRQPPRRSSTTSTSMAPSMSNTIQDIMSNLRTTNSPVLQKSLTASRSSMVVRPIAMPKPKLPKAKPMSLLPLPIPETILPDALTIISTPPSGSRPPISELTLRYRDPQLFREDAKMCGQCGTKYNHIKEAADCIKRHRLVRCYFCFALFDTTEALFKHYKETHGSRCPICEETVLFQQASMHAISKHLFECSGRNLICNEYNRNVPDHRRRVVVLPPVPVVQQETLLELTTGQGLNPGQGQNDGYTVENPIPMVNETAQEFETAATNSPIDPDLVIVEPDTVVKVEFDVPEEAETWSFN